MRIIYIILLVLLPSLFCMAQDKKSALPDLQTAESIFFDPTAKEKAEPYQFSTPWRIEVGYAQLNHRTQDTSAIYMHGLRVGATVDFVLPKARSQDGRSCPDPWPEPTAWFRRCTYCSAWQNPLPR